MAFLCQGFLVRLNRMRYCRSRNFHQSISAFQISTPNTQSSAVLDEPEVIEIEGQCSLQESYVLSELSNLLPISSNSSKLQPFQNKPVESRAVADSFLLPEERLRGVFLGKLKGMSSIERALTDVGVDVSLDIVSKVLNRGNLGAEWMTVFFNWAIKQPMISKDIHSYNVIIRALGRRKYVDFIVKILHELKAEGIELNLETLSIVMDSLVRTRRVYKAIQIFGNPEEFGFQWNTESLNVLLNCLCKRSHVGAANSYLNSVKGKILFDHETYNTILGGWSKFGRVGEIERILEAMVEDGFNPDCSTFSYLIEGLGRAGRIEDAIKIFDSMSEKHCVPNTIVYNAMISNFISIRDFDSCMKYYRCLLSSDTWPNIDTYTKLISAFIK